MGLKNIKYVRVKIRAENDLVHSTADSAGGMVDIHDRRPVVLTPELTREWLDPATPKERAEQMVLHRGEPAEAFEWFKVDMAVGNVRSKGPELIQPTNQPTNQPTYSLGYVAANWLTGR